MNSSSLASEKSKEKEKEKVKLQERANEIVELMRPPENYEELRAFVLYYMTTDKFNYPIDSVNLYRNIAFEFNKKLDDFKGLQRMEMEPLLEELQSKQAITLNRGSLGMKPVQYIYSTNRERVKELSREYLKDRPQKRMHGSDNIENGIGHEEVKMDAFHKMPPYPIQKPPPNHMMEPPQKFSTNIHAPPPINRLDIDLNRKSALEMERQEDTEEFNKMIRSNTAVEQMIIDYFKSKGTKKIDYCEHGTREKCNFTRKTTLPCGKVHFRKMLMPHTDPSLGNCSYLDTCRHMDTCRFVHYEIEEVDIKHDREETQVAKPKETEQLPAQWICADIREFDFTVMGKFDVLMCDPPWDIHMSLPYGTLKDKEMRTLPVEQLQDEGLMFLWVTGRAMELGRECLELWGYRRVEEIVWIKTNQLQRIIRTGRTGHWLNHSKEHCLVGIKGDPHINRNIDCDVIVSEVRETSRKPDEIYGLIERMLPGGRKAELFARPHNRRSGWVSLGNQLPGCYIKEPDMLKRYQERYPEANLTEELMEEYKKEDEKTIEYTYNNHIANSTTRSGSKSFA